MNSQHAETLSAFFDGERVDAELLAARASRSRGPARLEGEGQHEFRCAVDEAVAMLLPQPKSQARIQTAGDVTPRFADGVFAQGDKTVVDFARFFAGSEALVYIVVREQR